jgi:hypothetical protein
MSGSPSVNRLRFDSGELTDSLLVWYIRQWCLLHQLALLTKDSLKMMSQYFGNVAKFIHCWRSSGKHIVLKKAWANMVSEDRADVIFKRLPSKPLKGRWGAISSSEEHILKCGPTETRIVFSNVFDVKSRASKPRPKPKPEAEPPKLLAMSVDGGVDGDGGGDDDGTGTVVQWRDTRDDGDWLAVYGDDTDRIRERNSKWVGQTLVNVASDQFWIDVYIANTARRPIEHMVHYLQKGGAWPSKTKQLALGKSSQFEDEFTRLLSDDVLYSPIGLGSLDCMKLSEKSWGNVMSNYVLAVIGAATNFYRRFVVAFFLRFPLKLALMVYQRHDVPCVIRQGLVRELLAATTIAQLHGDPTTFKLKLIFETELLRCLHGDGTLDSELWDLISNILELCSENTHEIEVTV